MKKVLLKFSHIFKFRFHPECVQTTIEAVQQAGEYICHGCAFERVLQRETETEEQPIQQNIDDGVYYA